jgi:hypothetical protein
VGLTVNAATVVLWAVTRTEGLPIGPEHWTAEPVGTPDVIAGVLELVIVAGSAWALTMWRTPRSSAIALRAE